MALRTQLTALALLTSTTALVACTVGAAGDGTSNPAPSATTEEPSTAPAAPPGPKHGRVHMPIEAGKATTSAFIAKLFEADGGTDAATDGGSGPTYDHAYGDSFNFSFAGQTATAGSWVGISPVGAADWVYSWYAYPNGGETSFTFANDQLPEGTYVARLYNDSASMYTKTAETASFTVGPHTVGSNVSVNGSVASTTLAIDGFSSITAAYTGLQTNYNVTVGVFPTYGSNGLPYAMSGAFSTAEQSNIALGELLSGITYEVRVFEDGHWTQTSPTKFTVSAALRTKDLKSTYTTSESIEIEYAGVQGMSFDDNIEIVETSTQQRCDVVKKLDWYWSGSVTFGPCAAGTYVAKLRNGVGDTTTVQATSASFVVN